MSPSPTYRAAWIDPDGTSPVRRRGGAAPPGRATPAPRPPTPLDRVVWSRDAFMLGLGTQGLEVGARYLALAAREGEAAPVGVIDTAGALPAPQRLPGLDPVTFPPERFLLLAARPDADEVLTSRRAAVEAISLLRERYARLLRGIPVATTAKLDHRGDGGSAFPVLSLIELDLLIAEVRAYLRRLLTEAGGGPPPQAQGATGDDLLGRALRRAQQRPNARAPFGLVIAGLAGSAGNALAQYIGYLLREEAAGLGLPKPTLWLMGLGPDLYRHLTPRTDVNYAAALRGLAHLSRDGLDARTWIDGTMSASKAPPYDLILTLDGQRRTTDPAKERPTDEELDAFQWRTAVATQQLLRPQVQATLAGALANPVATEEETAPIRAAIFGVLQLAVAGTDRRALREVVAAQLAAARARALHRRLVA